MLEGLEGLVAKRKASVYESGRRSGAWVKFKITKSQEFLIGGYTLPEGSRSHFGSLLVGYQGPDGFLFAGRVGTGYSEKLLADLYACHVGLDCSHQLKLERCKSDHLHEQPALLPTMNVRLSIEALFIANRNI